MNDDADELRTRILAAAAALPAPTRAEASRRERVLLIASVAIALVIFHAAGGMDHASGRPLLRTWSIAGGWTVFTVALSWLVLWRRSTLGRPPAAMLAAALVTPVALFGWMSAFAGTYIEPFQRFGWLCMGYTLAMAALPLGSFLALRRGIEPRRPWALGAAIAAVCGAWAGILVELWCPLVNPRHVLVGHVVPVLVLMIAGAALGRSLLGVRRLGGVGARRAH